MKFASQLRSAPKMSGGKVTAPKFDPFKNHYVYMANYHVWAFDRLFMSVDVMTEEHYRKNVGLMFGSVHATLNRM